MKHIKKDIYFRDVHVFIKRCKNIIVIKSPKIIRNNFYICLHNVVLKWYIFTLLRKQKFFVKYKDNIAHWAKTLIKRWKNFFSTTLATITREQYFMNDARRRRESIEYA